MKFTKDGSLLAVAASSGEIYIHNATDHYSLKATTSEFGRPARSPMCRLHVLSVSHLLVGRTNIKPNNLSGSPASLLLVRAALNGGAGNWTSRH